MLHKGVISPSHSPWSSPVVSAKEVREWSSEIQDLRRLRTLNVVTMYDSYPLPRFEDTSNLSAGEYFIVLDCYSSFWQINIHEPHREKRALSVLSLRITNLTDCRMAYSNSPASFQMLMDVVLKNLIGTEY
jgi:hypothetical protein